MLLRRVVLIAALLIGLGQANPAWQAELPPPVEIANRQVVQGEVKLSYPEISGINAAGAEMTQTVATEIDRFAQGLVQPNYSGLTTFQVQLNRSGLLSLTLHEMEYAKHAAHPMTIRRAYTFDTRTGTVISLSDLFRPDTDYKERLSGVVRARLAKGDIPLLAPFTGIPDTQEYYLTDEGLVLYYQLYEYAPYAWGFLEFTCSYADIADILKPEYLP